MVLEFMELEYHGKILKIFYGTRVTIKKFLENLKYIFSKNSSFWNSSFTVDSSFTNSSLKKVVHHYIFPKQW